MQNPPNLRGNDYCQSPDGAKAPSGMPARIADFSTAFHSTYRANILNFLRATTMDLLETDGPYEGATCAQTNQSGFAHVNNSQLAQYRATVDFYRTLKRELNTFKTPCPTLTGVAAAPTRSRWGTPTHGIASSP